MTRADWILRPVLWLSTAWTIQIVLRESAHAPYSNLMAGLVCLTAYRFLSRSAAGLPLLYLSTTGLAMFFGHLMAVPAGIAGATASAAILFWQGRELQRWIPKQSGRISGVIAMTVIPPLVATGIVVLINLPLPSGSFVSTRAIEASFGVFAVIGAAAGARRSTDGRSFRLWWIDGSFLIAALLVARLMTRGIR